MTCAPTCRGAALQARQDTGRSARALSLKHMPVIPILKLPGVNVRDIVLFPLTPAIAGNLSVCLTTSAKVRYHLLLTAAPLLHQRCK